MKAKRTDSNQKSIVSALRSIPGVSVAVTSSLPEFLDIVVGTYWNKRNYLIEIKVPGKKENLRPSQEKFKEKWLGQYDVCESLDDVLKVIGIKS